MKQLCTGIALGSMVWLGGCAQKENLVFMANDGFGIVIGADASGNGGEFVLGYKGSDLAIVPVTAVQADGSEVKVGASQGNSFSNSFSVLGQFEGNAKQGKTSSSAGLGKFFATGMASQNLAHGFAKKMGEGTATKANCKTESQLRREAAAKAEAAAAAAAAAPAPAVAPALAVPAPAVAKLDEATQKDISQILVNQKKMIDDDKRVEDKIDLLRTTAQAPKTGESAKKQGSYMLFGQYDYLTLAAFDISAIPEGFRLTLGYTGRNFAVIPVIGRDANGDVVNLTSTSTTPRNNLLQDSYSVLGRFQNDNNFGPTPNDASNVASSSLGKFFSTGMAADVLSEGFQVKLCEEGS